MRSTTLLCGLLTTATATAQWTLAAPATTPPARSDAVMTFDLGAGRTMLFGGAPIGSLALRNDTWLYDGVDWTLTTPATSPTGRLAAGMANDFARGRTVLFGGITSQISIALPNNQTWEWDGANWAQITPAHSPAGLAYHAMCYDAIRGRVVLYGGSPNPGLLATSNQTWEFDGVDWTQVATATNPGGLQRPAMCFFTTLNRTVLFGGINPQTGGNSNTWSYDGTNWTQIATGPVRPSPRGGALMAYDSPRNFAVMYGGSDPVLGTSLSETWQFDGANWHAVEGAQPAARNRFTMAYDLVRGQFVMHGGVATGNVALTDTNELSAFVTDRGAGCAGSNGVPALSSVTAPRIGGAFASNLTNLVPNIGLGAIAVGLFPNTPSTPLDTYGMPGCRLHVQVAALLFLGEVNGVVTAQFTIPNDPGLFGTTVLQQGLSFDSGLNAAGLTVSNAIAATIGW